MTDENATQDRVRWVISGGVLEYALVAERTVTGAWTARATVPMGFDRRDTVCFAAGHLASPGEAKAAFEAVLRVRTGQLSAEEALGLTKRFHANLSNTERLLLDALIPVGQIVANARLRRVRVDAETGPELSEPALDGAFQRLRAKLDAETGGRVGVSVVEGFGRRLVNRQPDDHLEIGTLVFSPQGQVAWIEGRELGLSVADTLLLEPLMRVFIEEAESAWLAREELLAVLGEMHVPGTRINLRLNVDRLRRRLGPVETTGITISWSPQRRGFQLEFPLVEP